MRVTPKSSRDDVDGIGATADGHALKVRVRAVPDKGAANAAVIDTIARWLGIPKRTIALDSGTTSRVKTLLISGDPVAIARLLEAKLASLEPPLE